MKPEWADFTGAARLFVMWNAFLAFALELALFAFVIWWALALDVDLWLRLLIAVGAVLLLAVAWGTLVSPRARFRLSAPLLLGTKGALFAVGAAALWGLGYPMAAVVFLFLTMSNASIAAMVRADIK